MQHCAGCTYTSQEYAVKRILASGNVEMMYKKKLDLGAKTKGLGEMSANISIVWIDGEEETYMSCTLKAARSLRSL